MTIPGRGDLAPPHRQSPIARYATGAVVVILLLGGGFAAYKGLSGGGSAKKTSTLPLCTTKGTPKAHKAPAFPQSKVTVDNASLITGLATQIAAELKHRGFKIGTIGNAAKVGKGFATIRYSADRKVEATKLGAQITGAKLVSVPGSHVVELDINPKFTTLVPRHKAIVAFRLAVVQQHLATPKPTPSPTCRARS